MIVAGRDYAAGLAFFAIGFGALDLAEAQTIENADIFVAASELADEVELIRETMGRPYDESPRLPVSGITELELYFQARTLLIKSSRLANELAGAAIVPLPEPPDRDVVPADTFELVSRALEDIRRVRTELGIREEIQRMDRDMPISATGVFSVILDANRQLNLLLKDTVSAEDVYLRLSTAVQYAAGLVAAHGGDETLPSVRFETGRRPAHVYQRLLECIDILADIGAKSGVDIMSLSTRRNVPDDIAPGHVIDLVQFIVADLMLIARRQGVEPADLDLGPFPKHVFPSNSYQRAGVLKIELERLAAAL